VYNTEAANAFLLCKCPRALCTLGKQTQPVTHWLSSLPSVFFAGWVVMVTAIHEKEEEEENKKRKKWRTK
jgi:hypothetical protein